MRISYSASASAFDRIEQRFQALTAASARPLTIDGLAVGHGLPDREVPLNELRDLLLSRDTGNGLKDAAWAVLVRQARDYRDTWGTAAVGVMVPGLRKIAIRVSRGVEFHRRDLDSEVLLGFYEALLAVDPEAPRLPSLLWWAAYRRGMAARQAALSSQGFELRDSDTLSRRQLCPVGGHPDLVLVKAVGAGVLEPDDAELIGATRVAGELLTTASARMGMSYSQCHKRRHRAECRLARYLGHRSAITPFDDDDPPALLPVAA